MDIHLQDAGKNRVVDSDTPFPLSSAAIGDQEALIRCEARQPDPFSGLALLNFRQFVQRLDGQRHIPSLLRKDPVWPVTLAADADPGSKVIKATREDRPMKCRTFAEIFCEREGLNPADLSEKLFRLTLYPHARVIARLVRWFNPRHFAADSRFTQEVSRLRSLEDFSFALGNYLEHPSNRSLLRRRLGIRVSARRMFKIVRTVFVPGVPPLAPGGNTFEPFDRTGETLEERPDSP